MNRFLLRWGINTIALYIAIQLLPGLQHTGSGVTLLGVALLFGLVNAVLKPVLVILSCPLVLLSLGLFMLVINGLLLLLTARLSDWLNWGFTVDGLGWGIIGSIVISLVGFVFTALLAPEDDD
jgi:putative membrane protein